MAKAKRYNRVPLGTLKQAVKEKQNIDISNQDNMNAHKIYIIKRDGRKEPFNIKKLEKVLLWACPLVEMREELLRDTEIKLHKEIKIQDMYKQLIVTAVNKISMLNPMWEMVSAKLQLLEYYKESYDIRNHKTYPHIGDILEKGLDRKIFDPETISKYSSEEIEELNDTIDMTRDLMFTYKGLVSFFDKYCLNYTKTRKLELPQITYMRVAMALMVNEKNKIRRVKELYNAMSSHEFTAATPIMLNALTPRQQLSSCVLNTLADDTHNILDTGKNLGVYSKFKGGTALDISAMRAKGSYIQGSQGYSSGPVPFMKFFESIMKAWNQGGKRPGSLAIYFDWWHLDVTDILSLKSNGGTDENRARGLKYAIKLHKYFLDKVRNGEDIVLFDPKDVPNLIGKYGKEFEEEYENYCSKTSIRKKTVKARDLMYKIMKERSETGNIYLFHYENVNEKTLLNRYIGSSNLCTEILLPSRPSEVINEELFTMENNNKRIVKRYTAGEIALCNLSSVNLEKWHYMTDGEKWALIRTLVRGLDNTIDEAVYPVKEGKNSNLMYRYLGIGILNYTNWLALNECVIDTQEALELADEMMDDLSYRIIKVSMELAIEKGSFEKFYETEWSQGILPIHKANEKAKALTKYKVNMNKWNELGDEIAKNGLRNAQLMAIAPTATSGKNISATESIEPISNFFYKEEGTTSIPTLVANFSKNNRFYKKAFDCDQYFLVEHAGVRQKWIDQTQSVNVYIKRPDSLKELVDLHMYGFDLGMPTFYYLRQQKESDIEECESCT